MYACMYGCMDGWLAGLLAGWMDGCTYIRTYIRSYTNAYSHMQRHVEMHSIHVRGVLRVHTMLLTLQSLCQPLEATRLVASVLALNTEGAAQATVDSSASARFDSFVGGSSDAYTLCCGIKLQGPCFGPARTRNPTRYRCLELTCACMGVRKMDHCQSHLSSL